MFNKFKNALYGSVTNNESSGSIDYVDYKDTVIGKRIRGALTRSSSFRDELLSEVAKSRAVNNDDTNMAHSNLQRVRSEMLRRTTEDDSSLNTNSAHAGQQSKRHHHSNQTLSKWPHQKETKFRYTRPEFLQLKTDDEINVSADHQIRPIILPRDVSRLPWQSGYAECINAGKSAKNEDQAVCYQDVVVGVNLPFDNIKGQLPFTIFGLYDGHAGNAVAVAAAAELHHIISEKLRAVADILIALEFGLAETNNNDDDEFEDCISSPKMQKSQFAVQSDDKTNSDSQSDQASGADDGGGGVEQFGETNCDQTTTTMTTDETEPQASSLDSNNEPKSSQVENQSLPQTKIAHDNATKIDDNLAGDEPELVRADSCKSEEPSNTVENATTEDNPTHAFEYDSSFLATVIDLHRNNVTVESLIKGALESSFWEMDELIGYDKEFYKMPGGCAAIVSLFILGKLYVCNAGDSRAIVCKGDQVIPMSFDFTPTSERERILRLGQQRPELLGNDFTHLEFIRRPTRKDLGKRMLYRDAYMTGWAMKEISYDDLKFPLVWGEGKRSRLCACIGLSRGFGDHELRTQHGSVAIKPFLTPEPEVRVLDLESASELTNEDVLIQASDGLWDVNTNQEIFELVKRSLSIDNEVARSKYRYISLAQDLVGWSRGYSPPTGSWRMADGRFASMDDISVFVVPLKEYREEYLEWKRLRNEATVPNARGNGGAV